MSDIDLLALRQSSTLSELVADKMEKLILSGQLAAGERINEAVLAKELGVSRGPVREASMLLTSRGLVEFIAFRGAFVRKISRAELLEIYDLRAVLTGQACYLAALKAGGDAAPLNDLHDRMEKAADSNKADKYYTLNLKFHECLVDMAGSSRLRTMIDSLVNEMHLYRQVSLRSHPDMAQSNREHRAILDAIIQGDAEKARELGEAHVRAGKKRFEAAGAETLVEDE